MAWSLVVLKDTNMVERLAHRLVALRGGWMVGGMDVHSAECLVQNLAAWMALRLVALRGSQMVGPMDVHLVAYWVS